VHGLAVGRKFADLVHTTQIRPEKAAQSVLAQRRALPAAACGGAAEAAQESYLRHVAAQRRRTAQVRITRLWKSTVRLSTMLFSMAVLPEVTFGTSSARARLLRFSELTQRMNRVSAAPRAMQCARACCWRRAWCAMCARSRPSLHFTRA
jgi:hypothetical protein